MGFVREVANGNHDPNEMEFQEVDDRLALEVIALERLVADYRTKFLGPS